MTARLAVVNIAAFAMQVAVLVTAGAVLIRVFRIEAPRPVLAYWRTLLLACLLLPLCQPWVVSTDSSAALTKIAGSIDTTGSPNAGTVSTSRFPVWSTGEMALALLAAGMAARLLWLGIGAWALSRLRRRAELLEPLPENIRRVQERIGARAAFYISEQVSGPLTFGLLRPVVLFPPHVCALPPHVQEAVACHELLHVRRRDWVHELLEQIVTAILWFHPAIWLLTSRIRLAREQVVDEAAVALTESRERYVDSLLAVARASLFPSFTPASPFLRRHVLKQRVARLLQESTMTTRRLIASLTATGAALILCTTLAIRSFPLEAQGGPVADSNEPVQLIKGGEHLLHGQRPEYPHRAIEQNIEGDVVVEMTLDDKGEVADARVLSGPEELRRVTLESVLQWHYSPAALSSTVTTATLRFHAPAPGFEQEVKGKVEFVPEAGARTVHEFVPADVARHRLEEIERALADPVRTARQRVELETMAAKMRAELEAPREVEPESGELRIVTKGTAVTTRGPALEGPTRLLEVRTERVAEETAKELLQQAGVAVGDSITEETTKRVAQVASAMDEHFRVEYAREKDGVVMVILAR